MCSQRSGARRTFPATCRGSERGYPDINKLAILGDVAPYSREYNIFHSKVGNGALASTELRVEQEKILDRVPDPGVRHPDGQPGLSVLPQPKPLTRPRGKSFNSSSPSSGRPFYTKYPHKGSPQPAQRHEVTVCARAGSGLL